MRVLWACALFAVTACSGGIPDPPWIDDDRPPIVNRVAPDTRIAGEGGDTVIHGRFLKPSYNAWLDIQEPLVVWLDGAELEVLELSSNGTEAHVNIPTTTAIGFHDVRVRNGFGDNTLERGYLVKPKPCDAGSCP